jgi:hypothetical protein
MMRERFGGAYQWENSCGSLLRRHQLGPRSGAGGGHIHKQQHHLQKSQ